ncbi:hypothetical protein TBR22_A04930 [Luteitalea sp. TBR-22]|uniref:hypothetical protein n=1 Tax=Luteitalea sp. TBR-22 TaxID=2802971 RepID=UPI001AF0DC2B|nr:hypothetical protein [Luteitalea sp. TBR-22]BCS31293.1 hypothetical protein TBR22_A04930 [Luteitalea sp. TBR-22]
MTDTQLPPAPPPPSSRQRWLLPAAGLTLVLAALLAIGALRRSDTPRPAPAPAGPAAPAPPPVLAETTGEEGHLTIGVVSLDRVAADTLELRLAVTYTAAAGSPALDISQRFSADGPDRGTLAEVYLADLSHEHKFFVLRDGQNAPLGSRDVTPLAAGERRILWARYPAPGEEDLEVVVHVPHADPLPNVPVGQRPTNTP